MPGAGQHERLKLGGRGEVPGLGGLERSGRDTITGAEKPAEYRVVLPIPTAIIYAVAGWAGMGLVTFLILDAIGSLMWAGTLAGLGYELGHHAVVVAQTISHYGLWFSLAIVALVIFFQIRNARMAPPALATATAPAETEGADPG